MIFKLKDFRIFTEKQERKFTSGHSVKRKRLYKMSFIKINSLLRHINDVIMAGNFINPYTGCYK